MEQLGSATTACSSHSQHVMLDLAGATFVDRAGVEMLNGLTRAGAGLTGCSPFLDELLRSQSVGTAGSTDEAALVERLRAGDSQAFETVTREYGGRLLATARRFLRNEDDAQDAVQDAFLSAWK